MICETPAEIERIFPMGYDLGLLRGDFQDHDG
jgi:hypothetical protein